MTVKNIGEITLKNNENYTLQKGLLGSQMLLKLPFMRKQDKFEIYNFTKDSKTISFQGDNKCFVVSIATGKALYSNKGNMPIEFYACHRPTHAFIIANKDEFINTVYTFLRGDNRNKEDGSTEVLLFGT